MVCSSEEKLYAIRDVAEITGVKPVTLRAWQRRYNLIQPQRTEKGHRLYRQQELDTIREIQGWLSKGIAIGKVKGLLGQSDVEISAENHSLEEVETVLSALSQLNRGKTESVLSSVLKEYPLNLVVDQFINPVFEALDLVKGSLRSLQMGLFQTCLITRLALVIDSENKASTKGKCLLISFEQSRDAESWIQAAKLCEQGYHITLVDKVDDVSGLVGHDVIERYQRVYVFSNKALPAKQVEAFKALLARYPEQVQCSEVIEKLHLAQTQIQ
ncbi:MerR family transcriptional regulator [Vibrio parahaemolyticus]|uniref:MerR family transcriptional regulator n=1 Tax=Vibrio parahaemolyticus TaxID=670 RepID=UPI0005F1CEB3|nr:MerR family transcriptional regulator [Vibrio parahaemolyticus]EGQ7682456.1 MerR family transcriptional regulator [Vibrio parahaemolyticus]EHR0919276.1 MerR family transcriptional regulator [Vibrio parahaemolyticus]EHZ2783706.1 MerR family transcriptional regulator [Vibrio parahaemolyticus]ELA7193099.1 MerR family transcriptional regulator [Vibrio parahaemolyticus]KOY27499.1 MerR family transcriptional regulator [Vibrio parahaemolyticus]